MVKKTLLSLAIAASAAGMAGCNISSVEKHNNNVDTTPVDSGVVGEGGTAREFTQVIYNPSAKNAAGLPDIPLITDLLLQGLGDPQGADTDGATDGTIPFAASAIGAPDYNPIFSAVSDLDGFSTTAAIDIPFGGPLDDSSLVVTPGPTANVILIPLNYTNDPVRGGAPENNDAPQLDLSNPVGAPASIEASVVSYSDLEGANNILRIMPKAPLKPATRYLVVVTDGVKNAAGIGVQSSATFNLMASASESPNDPTAAKLYGAIQQWVTLAKQVGAGFGQQLETADIAYATTFTTAGTTQVLGAMASPSAVNAAVAQTLPADLRYLMEQGFVAGNDAATIVGTLVAAINAMPDGPQKDGLIAALGGQENMATTLGGAVALGAHLPQPVPRVAEFSDTQADLTAIGAAGLNMANGSIKLPYYLSAPDTSSIANLSATAGRVFTEFWQADDTLGTDLSALLTAAGIPAAAVTPPSTNVTRHFPLAKTGTHTSETNPLGYVDVPISVYYSAAAAPLCQSGWEPVIYQHGITTNRLAAIPFAGKVIGENPCTAVIAIDLPMHGLEPDDPASQFVFTTFENGPDAATKVLAGTLKQRHFSLTMNKDSASPGFGQPRSMFETTGAPYADLGSGSLFINIVNFQNTRDNMRQAVMDLLNLNASIKYLDFDGNPGADIDTSKTVDFAGHSLGAIVGTPFLALSNALGGTQNPYLNTIESGVLANPGGHVTKLLENSFAFGPDVLNGFAGLNPLLGQGKSLFEVMMHVFQATIDSADPVNFAPMLSASAANNAVLMFEIAGDGTNPQATDATNRPDTAVPPAAFAENGLAPAVELDTDDANDKFADTAAAPLVGSTPLAAVAGLDALGTSVAPGATPIRNIIRFTDGTHSSFGTTNDSDPTGNNGTVHKEMMSLVNSLFSNAGKGLDITDGNVIAPASN